MTADALRQKARRHREVRTFQLRMAQILEARIDQNAWRRRAACVGRPPEMFFPPRGHKEMVAAAVAVCAGCPVREPCLEAHLSPPWPGICGGLTPNQRRTLARERRRAAERGAA